MRRALPSWGAPAALALGLACRQAEPPPQPTEPSAEREARELVERARRDVEKENEAAGSSNLARSDDPRLFIPQRPHAERLALLVFLHGLGGSGRELREGLHLAEMAEAYGFAFLAPEGHVDRSGRRFWNAGETCCDFDGSGVDHVAALRRWIGAAVAHPRVDPGRVWLIGFSNGGFLAYRAACELGAPLAGIVSIAGAGRPERAQCRPVRQLDVVQIHGDRDAIVKIDGGYLFADTRRPRYPSAEKSLSFWAELDGCRGELQRARTLDLDPRAPGAETVVSSHGGCSGGRVELWTIAGGDHVAGLNRFSLKAVWDFISAQTGRSR